MKAALESFAGNKSRIESLGTFRRLGRYGALAQLHGFDLFCLVSYQLGEPNEYPWLVVTLESQPRAVGRDASVAAMQKIALRDGWEVYALDDPTSWASASCEISLAAFLQEEDHVAAVQRFFVESIHQLREELTAFKKASYPSLSPRCLRHRSSLSLIPASAPLSLGS